MLSPVLNSFDMPMFAPKFSVASSTEDMDLHLLCYVTALYGFSILPSSVSLPPLTNLLTTGAVDKQEA